MYHKLGHTSKACRRCGISAPTLRFMAAEVQSRILLTMEKHGIFSKLKPEEIQSMIKEIVNVSEEYDCNAHEILEGIGKRLKICYYCLNFVNKFAHGSYGICEDCDKG